MAYVYVSMNKYGHLEVRLEEDSTNIDLYLQDSDDVYCLLNELPDEEVSDIENGWSVFTQIDDEYLVGE